MCWRDTLSNEEWWAQFRAETAIHELLHPQVAPEAPMTNTPIDPTGPLGEAGARLRALVATWRAEADAEDARLKQYCYGGDHDGDMLDEDLSRGFTVNARMKRCAAELDALLSAPVVTQEGE
jgi:hypothetical protein